YTGYPGHGHWGGAWSAGCAGAVPVMVYVPVVLAPSAACCATMRVPRDIDVTPGKTSPATVIGGGRDARLAVGYLVETGATAPAVTVTLTRPDGTTATWSASDTAVGWHAYDDILEAPPGSKVTLAATGATARLSWCETICC
ncbi:MAG TPA: hypothetical protein VET85_06010, partial [Stellaceae bacterium]|nr:hypothetical protein [Stellaceae bacterium]